MLHVLREGGSRADCLAALVHSGEFQARLTNFSEHRLRQPTDYLADTAFLTAAYRELLGRAPDSTGFDAAIKHLTSGGTRRDLLHAMVDSAEFENRLLTSTDAKPLPSLVAMQPHRYRRSGEFLAFIVKSDEDYDWLEEMITDHGYYERPGPWRYGFNDDKANLSRLVSLLRPQKVLEVGCGDGGTLHGPTMLGIDCVGLDVSEYARERALPDVRDRVLIGDLLRSDHRFPGVDTVCGFDIFEHLNPNRLPQYLQRCASILPDDGLLLINAPVFGTDDLFGDAMGVWTDEWRKDLQNHVPFSFIPCDDHGFPMMGHLVWADSKWWEQTFQANGFLRVRRIERALHQRFDPIFEYSHARRAFMLLAKRLGDTRQDALAAQLAIG